ncbi:hypothetical protein AMATHDRAFT_53785 [Amanita thiersii Skay4041]|uniref:NOT2/NOT3/NOT5 C-terminal domain-containing protein n=1 Tax=Amanita thiersii Skay4041 TaxID=703135 RepID=A0A2A9P0S3_9AGAR|nr:hypothetical protein AMATHDRAFT_53785 [Amanita thiersii Skay4041]
MNRPGQPQQRPPSLAPNPALANQFRPPYPTYGLPPRNVSVLQGGGYVPQLQTTSHRSSSQQSQVQNMGPQPTPGFLQQRAQAGFGFSGALGQHQPNSLQQQQQQIPPQQQANGTSSSIPLHLAQTPNLGAASVTSTSEVNLDPNDFPALGSTPANNNTSSSNAVGGAGVPATSYASQAGLGNSSGGGSGTGGIGAVSSQTRDFTLDDFPALGGQSQSQTQNSSQNQNASQDNHTHPPGLNGFQHSEHPQHHRQNLLGTLSGNLQQTTPGMLNLGTAQSRNIHPGFQQGQAESEKQQRNNYPLKVNQTHAAWNSPNINNGSQPQSTTGNQSGTQQNGTHPNQNATATQLNAPPGVPPLSGSLSHQQSQLAHNTGSAANTTGSFVVKSTHKLSSHSVSQEPLSNPNNPTSTNANNTNAISSLTTSSASQQHPQTPAQQILMSAADRWGLLGLLAMIRNAAADVDQGLTSIGTDLGTMGLDMGYNGNLYSTFITPWADQSAAHTVEPDFRLPACYANVLAPPPGPSKAAAFSDETLFFMFYSSPRDALQEIAAQELYNRNWRYHKELRLWITKESGMAPSQKVQGGEQGQYTIWDPENWTKERKEMTVMYSDLEEKTVPAFAAGPNIVLAQHASQGQTVGQVTSGQLPGQVSQAQVQVSQRSFPIGMGL